MWYRYAAFGTIDLQKYTSENEDEDYDFEKELMSLLQSGITDDGFVIYDVLNNNLPKSKLKKYISFFWRSTNPEALASYNRRTKEVKLNHLKPGETINDLAQTLRHELRHAVDKGHDFRPKWISNFEVSLTTKFFYKFKNLILNSETNEIKYDQDKLIFMMVYDFLRTTNIKFDSAPEDIQNYMIQDTISKNIKRPDQILEVIQKLANGESKKDVSSHYYINNPQEYTTLLSDIDELFSPQAFMSYVNQFDFMEKEKLVDALRYALSKMSDPSVYAVLRDISSEGANLLVHILMFAKNEQMQKNVYRIVNNNFQQFLSEYSKEESPLPDQFKEAKKGYNAPRTGKKKKRWSTKYKGSINCSNTKGFSQKQYCKRKRSGGNYKTEG
jgi:hypothetical protein